MRSLSACSVDDETLSLGGPKPELRYAVSTFSKITRLSPRSGSQRMPTMS